MSPFPDLLPAAALLAPTPRPPVQVPVNTAPPATAPVLDLNGEVRGITADVLDIGERISNLDEPLIQETRGTRDKITVAAVVLFAFDKAALTSKARSRLAETARLLTTKAHGKQVRVDGYTDAKGSDAYNQTLSRARAQAVQRALTKLLAGSGTTLTVQGHGAADPVAPNTTPEGADSPAGRAKNRRVEISFPR
ncbi:OmpA family protein [Actinomadura sp. ATCC 39365]